MQLLLEMKTPNFKDTVAAKITRLVEESGLKESEISRRSGVPQPTIQRIRAGTAGDPKVSSLAKLAKYFRVSIGYLIGEEDINKLTSQDVDWQLIKNISESIDLEITNIENNRKNVKMDKMEIVSDIYYELLDIIPSERTDTLIKTAVKVAMKKYK